MGLSVDEMTRGMLAAGMIGVFIAAHATFAAETGGCQAECGAGSGMAAAALVTLAKGTTEQAIAAASMALQNILGMICDPVANRVEVPCLGKNVMAASNALACANMALAGYDAVIPLDEVIETMDRVGKALPRELRCTGLGGLSVTGTSREIELKLNARGHHENHSDRDHPVSLPVGRFRDGMDKVAGQDAPARYHEGEFWRSCGRATPTAIWCCRMSSSRSTPTKGSPASARRRAIRRNRSRSSGR